MILFLFFMLSLAHAFYFFIFILFYIYIYISFFFKNVRYIYIYTSMWSNRGLYMADSYKHEWTQRYSIRLIFLLGINESLNGLFNF